MMNAFATCFLTRELTGEISGFLRIVFIAITCVCLNYPASLQAQTNEDQLLLESLEDDFSDDLQSGDKPQERNSALSVASPEYTKDWRTFYFKALHHHAYRLTFSYTEDTYGIPVNPGQLESSKDTRLLFSAGYVGQSKIHISDNLFSYFHFDYAFEQVLDTDNDTYKNYPAANLYQAYLQYHTSDLYVQMGGLVMPLGVIDIDSPIDILNLSDLDKTAHLDRENNKIIMVAVKMGLLEDDSSWELYWSPFQRVSEEDQSVRATSGVRYQISTDSFDMGFMLFRWFDPDSALQIEIDGTRSSDTYLQPIITNLEDTPMTFAAMDLDLTAGNWVIKAETGYFAEKNFYHFDPVRLKRAGANTILETVSARHFVFACSVEKKYENLFLMPVYSYRRVIDAPAETIVYQYENVSRPASETRDLDRHQINGYLEWAVTDRLKVSLLGFTSAPFRITGFSNEWTWGEVDDGGQFRLLVSRVQLEKNKLTGLPTRFQRIQTSFSAHF